MANPPLARTTYRDPNTPGNPVRSGNTTHAENALDMDQYYRPLEAIHDASLHGPGVGSGLSVTATLNNPDLNVLAGVALDANGRHISLAVGGNAEIGQNADAPGTPATLTGVTAGGASIPTTNLGAGDKFVTIQFWETFDSDAYLNYGIYRYNHTPWIRLLPTVTFVDDGTRIVLAKVTLDANSRVIGLTNDLRHGTDLPVESVHLRKGQTVTPGPSAVIDNVPSGEIRARPQGGIQVKVQDQNDEIHLERAGGNFAKVVMAANQVAAVNQVTAGDVVNPGIVLDGGSANIIAGTAGNEGDVLVRDAGNRLTVALNGANGHVIVGAAAVPGQVRMLNQQGQDSLHLDGVSGAAVVKRLDPMDGTLIDVGARFFRIHGWDLVLDGRSGGNKRALVDLGNRLVVNFNTDYGNGVDIGKLHLSDHIRLGYWERFNVDKRPTYNQWITLFEIPTNLPSSEWVAVTMCEIGMLDDGTVDNFWWGASNSSYNDTNGNIVIRWDVNYRDGGDDWRPWKWNVMMIAVRR